MLPGNNFGIDDDELITRIAFVDFDGNAKFYVIIVCIVFIVLETYT